MATKMSNQVEGDRRLLRFHSYEDYLDSFVTPTDLKYLRSTVAARAIAELGYRSSGETLSRELFHKRLKAVKESLYPSRKPYQLCSVNLHFDDDLLKELALRERPNRVGLLATIIFLRDFTRIGHEISCYIDFAERLKTENWLPIFEGRHRIWPRPTDLGYYHWKTGKNNCNSSGNYKVSYVFCRCHQVNGINSRHK
ncbi:unnamed protein product [Timema podura]|uniref:Cilia- and flagella-associated protein 299 n=1 Tax=Timema podura TaxID=61482 RepID=A0ABN7NYL7_TIMPD|nr:unnamed protein product [Timema podura]